MLTSSTRKSKAAQSGIVLILALIMLVVISLLTALAVRNATSSEAVNSNVRQTQLATQAAETALRYCEDAVINLVAAGTATFNFTSPPNPTTTITLDATYIHDMTTGTPTSMIAANWDTTTAGNKILIVPADSVNRAGITSTFSRSPECIVDRLSPSTSVTYSKNFIITARGFGPEVAAANSTRDRPVGSEVFMQSSLELQ